MTLVDILDEDIIDLEVAGSNKDEVLRNLSKRLYQAGYISDVDQFIDDIYVREAEGPTGMGNYISIPHGKSKAVKKIGIAIGRLQQPVKWESSMSEDGVQDTNIIFLFCVSDDGNFATNHMMLLAELAGKLGNEHRLTMLQDVKSKEDLIEAILKDPQNICASKTGQKEMEVELDIDIL